MIMAREVRSMSCPITSAAGLGGTPSTGDSFIYRIDARDQVNFVTADWLAFAKDNEAQHLSAETVQGESLFSFIDDSETRHLYKSIIDKVRRTQASVTVPFRCDSPGLRRFMVLHISPLPHGAIQFEGRLIREEPREHVPLLDADSARNGELIVSCSWCKRIEVDGAWLEVEEAVRRLELFHEPLLPQITHGICGDCLETFRQDLNLEPQG
jgi:hypothetical protein